MHICFITHEYPQKDKPNGGIGTFVSTLGPALAADGHLVSVIGFSKNEMDSEETDRNVQIIRLRKSTWKKFRFIDNSGRLNTALRNLNSIQPFDIIETPELGLAFLNKIPKIKYVIRLHGGHHFFAEAEKRKINFWKGFQEKRSFRKADAFIGVSRYVVEHTQKYLSFDNKPVQVISNPIDSDKFFNSIKIKVIPNRILFVGTICEKKGVRELILAFKRIQKDFVDAKLMLTGRDWKYKNGDSYTEEMKQLMASNNIDGIEFTGPVNYNDLPQIYEEAELCVFPSHMETQGIVALEAMSMAKPVIFSKLGPGEETIENGVNGLLVDPYSPVEIGDKIKLLLTNKKLAIQMGDKARESINQKYNLNTIVKENVRFYQKIIQS